MRPLLAVVQLATMMPMLVLFTNFQSGFDELGQHYTEVCSCACLLLSLSLSLYNILVFMIPLLAPKGGVGV